MNKLVSAVGLTVCLVVAGCATTVEGDPVADLSAVPKPETGSFSTAARTLGPVTQAMGLKLEGFRMAETVPKIYEIDPDLRYRGKLSTGSMQPDPEASALSDVSVKSIFGDVAQEAFGKTAELGVMVGASDFKPGAKASSSRPSRGVTVAVVRMPSPDAASRGVSSALMAEDKGFGGDTGPKKVAATIPGFDSAVAYTKNYGGSTGIETIAYLAHKQYVIGVYGDFSVEQIRAFFDKQSKALDGFTATPLDKVTGLPVDDSGVARLTLAPARGNDGYSVPAAVVGLEQTDVARSAKTFADAGVDVIARGGNSVYRARDADAAKHVLDEFSKETREAYPGVQEEQVKGAPGATCFTYATYPGSTTKVTSCFAPVGRYLAEAAASQRTQAVQAIGASYLVLQSAK